MYTPLRHPKLTNIVQVYSSTGRGSRRSMGGKFSGAPLLLMRGPQQRVRCGTGSGSTTARAWEQTIQVLVDDCSKTVFCGRGGNPRGRSPTRRRRKRRQSAAGRVRRWDGQRSLTCECTPPTNEPEKSIKYEEVVQPDRTVSWTKKKPPMLTEITLHIDLQAHAQMREKKSQKKQAG